MFGTDQLRTLLADTPGHSADELASRVETAVLDFTGRQIADDTALLVLHVPATHL